MTEQEELNSLMKLQELHSYLRSINNIIYKPVYNFICDIKILNDNTDCMYEDEDVKGIINIASYNAGFISFPYINENYHQEYTTNYQYFDYDIKTHVLSIKGKATPPKNYGKYTVIVDNYKEVE
jgi:hypothetical protein